MLLHDMMMMHDLPHHQAYQCRLPRCSERVPARRLQMPSASYTLMAGWPATQNTLSMLQARRSEYQQHYLEQLEAEEEARRQQANFKVTQRPFS
jgi:hypothetical protein